MCSWNEECSAFHFDKIGRTCSLGAKDDLALIPLNFIPPSLGLLQTKLEWSPGTMTLTEMSYSLMTLGGGVISKMLFDLNLLTLLVR
jgi:hypothetical protein